MVRYRQLNSIFFTDTMYVMTKAKSTRGNTCAQLFVSDKALLVGYPMHDTKSSLNLLKIFAMEVGALQSLYAMCSQLKPNAQSMTSWHKLEQLY